MIVITLYIQSTCHRIMKIQFCSGFAKKNIIFCCLNNVLLISADNNNSSNIYVAMTVATVYVETNPCSTQ